MSHSVAPVCLHLCGGPASSSGFDPMCAEGSDLGEWRRTCMYRKSSIKEKKTNLI